MNLLEKGYGITSKIVMKDKKLPIKSKGIYIFLCSYADESGIAFPKRDTIMKYLGFGGKNTYYKYLNILIDMKYIEVEQKVVDGKFSPNIYKITKEKENIDLYSKGFGIVPREIMNDKCLSMEAKVVYAYLSCYSNKDKVSFMNIDQIKSELNIPNITVSCSLNNLLKCKYISKEQNIVKNKFSSNSYRLLNYGKNTRARLNEHHEDKTIEKIKVRDEKRKDSALKDYSSEKLKRDILQYEEMIKDNINYSEMSSKTNERITENNRELERITENNRELERTTKNNRELERITENNREQKNKLEFYNNVVNLIVETIFSEEDSYKINGVSKPKALIVNMLLKLRHEHIEFAYEKIKTATENGYIKSPKAYLLNVLYNTTQDMFIDYSQRTNTR